MQLEAKRGGHGNTVSNSAYQPKMEAITANEAPDYLLRGFDPEQWLVQNLFLVPGHFLTPSVVEKRAPLKRAAIGLGQFEHPAFTHSRCRADRSRRWWRRDSTGDDRDQFEQTAFLSQTDSTARDWTTAVLVSTTWISSRVIGST